MSSVQAIARPYAKALFMFAQEQHKETVLSDFSSWLDFVFQVGRHPLTIELLNNPVHTKLFRLDFYLNLTKEVLPDLSIMQAVQDFLSILTEQDRLILLPEIAEAFEAIRRVTENSTKVEVISAQKLSADEQVKLISALSTYFSSSIELVLKEDASLLAGVIIRAEDTILDGTVLGKVRQLREALA